MAHFERHTGEERMKMTEALALGHESLLRGLEVFLGLRLLLLQHRQLLLRLGCEAQRTDHNTVFSDCDN